MTLDDMIREAAPPYEKDEEEVEIEEGDEITYEDDNDDLAVAVSLLLQLRNFLEEVMFESKHMIMKKSMKEKLEENYYDLLSFLTNYDAEKGEEEKELKIINVVEGDYMVD
jgi:hypothetical protein